MRVGSPAGENAPGRTKPRSFGNHSSKCHAGLVGPTIHGSAAGAVSAQTIDDRLVLTGRAGSVRTGRNESAMNAPGIRVVPEAHPRKRAAQPAGNQPHHRGWARMDRKRPGSYRRSSACSAAYRGSVHTGRPARRQTRLRPASVPSYRDTIRASRFQWPPHAYSVLDSYVYGFTLNEQSLPFDTSEQVAVLGDSMLSEFPTDAYHNLAEFMTEHAMRPGYEYGKGV
jgi:hypothetical protein